MVGRIYPTELQLNKAIFSILRNLFDFETFYM